MISDIVSSAIRRSNNVLGWASRARLASVIMVAGIAVAAWGQYILASDRESVLRGALFMTAGGLAFLAALLVGWQTLDAEATLDDEEQEATETSIPWGLRQKIGLTVGILGGLAGFFLNDDNTFTAWGSALWLLGCLAIVLAFWPSQGRAIFRLPKLHLSSAWVLAGLAATLGLAAFLRFYDLNNTIREMNFDHASIVIDIGSVGDGVFTIFFEGTRGGAGESLFMYLGTGLVPFFGYSYLTIKVLSAIIGVLTVAATYFMTKELFGNRRIALIAAVLISLSFWHLIISRVGYRHGLDALLVALILLFLFRALRYNRSSDFVFTGLFLGVALYAYTGARIVPLAVGLILAISLFSRLLGKRAEWRTFALNSALVILTALVVYAPLGGYSLDRPDWYWQRLGDTGPQQESDAFEFLRNNFKATLLMFNWKGGFAPELNAPDSAQLDYVTGAAFVLGVGAMAFFWLRRRRGEYAYVGLAFLIMMVPAIVSTHTDVPIDGPARPIRAVGVIPLLFAAAALPFYLGAAFLVKAFGRVALVLALPLLGLALGLVGFLNYDTYFDDYGGFNHLNSKNVSEYGALFQSFEKAGGDLDNAYLKDRPHFVDRNILTVEIGDLDWPKRNWFHDLEEAREHALSPEAKLYVVALDDGTSLLRLQEIHPRGSTYKFESPKTRPGLDFGLFVFVVPAEGEAPMQPLPNTHLIREGG